MGRNQTTWSHRTNIIFREINIISHHFGSLAGFPDSAIVLWQENVRGTRNASFVGNRYNVVLKYLRQRSNGLRISLPAAVYIFVCFLCFIRYNKTAIACGYRNYENVFTHEYRIPLGRALGEYDTLGWIIVGNPRLIMLRSSLHHRGSNRTNFLVLMHNSWAYFIGYLTIIFSYLNQSERTYYHLFGLV